MEKMKEKEKELQSLKKKEEDAARANQHTQDEDEDSANSKQMQINELTKSLQKERDENDKMKVLFMESQYLSNAYELERKTLENEELQREVAEISNECK